MKSVQSHTRSNRDLPECWKGILRVGLTGGIGSGKSAVCSMLQGYGIPIFDADSIARILMVRDTILKRRIIAGFGSHMYNADGSLNRQAMSGMVFSDPVRRKQLEHLVHPRVMKEIDRFFNDTDTALYGIVEAALIYEAGIDSRLDYTIVVDAEERNRIARIHDRDGMAGEDIRQRMKAQMPVEEKRRRADFVIINNGTLDDLNKQVFFIHTILSGLGRRPPESDTESGTE